MITVSNNLEAVPSDLPEIGHVYLSRVRIAYQERSLSRIKQLGEGLFEDPAFDRDRAESWFHWLSNVVAHAALMIRHGSYCTVGHVLHHTYRP